MKVAFTSLGNELGLFFLGASAMMLSMETAEITLTPDEIRVLELLAAQAHDAVEESLPERMLREVNTARLKHMESVAVFLAAMDLSPLDSELKTRIKGVCDAYVRQEQGSVKFRMKLDKRDLDEAASMSKAVNSWIQKLEFALPSMPLVSLELSGEEIAKSSSEMLPAKYEG